MGRRKKGEAQLTKIEALVLRALIRLRGDAYGISIHKDIAMQGEVVSIAGVYFALERMEAAGYVMSQEGTPDPTRGGKSKTFFQITAQGADVLDISTDALEAQRQRLQKEAWVKGAAWPSSV